MERAFWMSLALAALAMCEACSTSWRETWVHPEQLIEIEHPDEMGVTLEDGSRLVVHDPVIQGDTLQGWREAPDALPGHEQREPVSIPLSQITATQLRHDSMEGALVLTGGVLLVFTLLAVGVAAGS